MFGTGTGDLNVMLLSADGSSGTRVWGETGDGGNEWKNGKVTIVFDTPFRVSTLLTRIANTQELQEILLCYIIRYFAKQALMHSVQPLKLLCNSRFNPILHLWGRGRISLPYCFFLCNF